MSLTNISPADLVRYAAANPTEFSMLKGYSIQPENWTQAQRTTYLEWSLKQTEDFVKLNPKYVDLGQHAGRVQYGFADDGTSLTSESTATTLTSESTATTLTVSEPSEFTLPSMAEVNSVLAKYGQNSDGFGPGDYSKGYTGEGDRIYWGGGQPSSTEVSLESIRRGQVGTEMRFRAGVDSGVESSTQFSGSTGIQGQSYASSEYLTMPTVSSVELQELPSSLLGMKNVITPFETVDGPAVPWEMGAQTTGPSIISSLEDLPEIPEMDVNMLKKLGISKPEMSEILNDSFVGVNAAGVASYNLNRFVNGIRGAVTNLVVIAPLLSWVKDNLGPVGEGIYGTVNLVGAVNMLGLLSGEIDPVGLAVQAAMAVVNVFNDQQQRMSNNDYAGKLDSSRAMMVRSGGKWYPGFVVNRTESEGLLFPGTDMLEVRYGLPEDLYFVKEAGMTKAFFKRQKNRQFRIAGDTWNDVDGRGGYEWMRDRDPLRGFYFLTPEETRERLQGYGTPDFAWKVIEDDTAIYHNPLGKKMLEVQSALEFIQDHERKSGSPDEYMVSPTRGLRRQFQEHLNYYGIVNKWQQKDDSTHWKDDGLSELARKILPDNMLALEDYRRAASDSVDGMWWKMYVDNAKDLPMANDFEELQAQYTLIDNYHDRNNAQKDYLRQKAGVRYEMNVVNQMNVGYDLYDELNRRALSSDSRDLYHNRDHFLSTEGGKDDDLLYSENHWGLFPIQAMWTDDARYDFATVGEGTRKANLGIRHLPSWYNKGDGLLPAGMDLGSYNDDETGWDSWSGNNKTALENFIAAETGGDEYWENKIAEEGEKTNEQYLIAQENKEKANQGYQTELARIERLSKEDKDPFMQFVIEAEKEKDTPEEQARRLENQYFTYQGNQGYGRTVLPGFGYDKQREKGVLFKHPLRTQEQAYLTKREGLYVPTDTKQRVAEWKRKSAEDDAFTQKTAAAKTDMEKYAEAYVSAPKKSKGFSETFVSGELKGQIITYDKWKQQVSRGMLFEPAHVGEQSYQHAAESILLSDAWIPKEVPLSEENFPSWWVVGSEKLWEPLLEHIDKIDDPDMKQRANYLHNLVGQKQSSDYLKRFHPTSNLSTTQLGNNLAGTHGQLSDDWSVAFKPHENSVFFNHQLHSQLDVGVQEVY